jgi:hypothetical protein
LGNSSEGKRKLIRKAVIPPLELRLFFNNFSTSQFPSPLGERVRVRGGRELRRINIDKCRELRKKQTDAEKKLWEIL